MVHNRVTRTRDFMGTTRVRPKHNHSVHDRHHRRRLRSVQASKQNNADTAETVSRRCNSPSRWRSRLTRVSQRLHVCMPRMMHSLALLIQTFASPVPVSARARVPFDRSQLMPLS